VQEAWDLDNENGNTLWWDVLVKEMRNVKINKGSEEDLIGYAKVDCHVIWDVKLGANF